MADAAALSAGVASSGGQAPGRFNTFPEQIFRVPRSWVEKSYPHLVFLNEAAQGGHFAAWEEPDRCSEEIWAAFRSLR
jgi:hypothetical protein